MIRVLLAAALSAPLLTACVIYADETRDDVVVRVGDAVAEANQPLEAVRSARIEGDRLVVRVESNGCTDASSFAVEITDADEDWTDLALKRQRPDLCKALAPDGVEVSWTFSELGLESGVKARLLNPTRL